MSVSPAHWHGRYWPAEGRVSAAAIATDFARLGVANTRGQMALRWMASASAVAPSPPARRFDSTDCGKESLLNLRDPLTHPPDLT